MLFLRAITFSCFILLSYFSAQSFGAIQVDTIQTSIYAAAAFQLVDSNTSNPDFVILDVRTASEFNADHIANAINIDYYGATFSTELDKLDRSKIYLMHCAGGSRSANVFTMMKNMKFAKVYQLLGGFNGWKAAGYPTDKTTDLSSIVENNRVSIYPNPAVQSIIVSSKSIENTNTVRIQVLNALGQVVIATILQQTSYNSCIIDISVLEAGIYFVRIGDDDNTIIEKFVKK